MSAPRIDLIHDLVSVAAETVPHRLAIIAAGGTQTTFAQFEREVRTLAHWVSGLTVRGDRVAVIADNDADYARLYYAVPRSGRVLTLVNQRLGIDEQVDQLAATGPTLLVGQRRYLEVLPTMVSVAHVVAFESPQWPRAQTDSL